MLLRREVAELKRKVARIEVLVKEDYELSDWAKKELAIARTTPKGEYVKNKEILKEFLVK